jgi:hypothetical protein
MDGLSGLQRRVRRYQRGNQNPYIEEEQTTQRPKENKQKDKQWSTKHIYIKQLKNYLSFQSFDLSVPDEVLLVILTICRLGSGIITTFPSQFILWK